MYLLSSVYSVCYFFTYFDCNIYTLFHKLARIIIAIASLEKGYPGVDLWMLILENNNVKVENYE